MRGLHAFCLLGTDPCNNPPGECIPGRLKHGGESVKGPHASLSWQGAACICQAEANHLLDCLSASKTQSRHGAALAHRP